MNGSSAKVLVGLLVGGVTWAQSGASVCGKISYGPERVTCLSAISGRFIQPGAAGVCGTISYGPETIDCLKATLDRVYTDDELEACKAISYGPEKVACMAGAGVVRPREESRSTRRRSDLDDADEDMRPQRSRSRADDEVPRAPSGFNQGDWVLARWKRGRYWFAGVVESRSDGIIRVRYDDGMFESLFERDGLVRGFDWRPGTRLECKWTDGQWYWAKIKSIDGSSVRVRFDDGVLQTTSTGQCRSQ